MDADYEKTLETDIDRELKRLPELSAPHSLLLRVMSAIEHRATLPWYRQSWQTWPMALRIASLVVLAALFGGLCFGGRELTQTQAFGVATHALGGILSGVGAIWNALTLLVGAVGLIVKHLGTGFIIACLVSVALGYAICVSLGTVYVRLALARR